MFAVQFGVTADYTFGQALFAVAMLALLAIKNTLSIWMKSAIILGYHGGCRVLKKYVYVKDRARFVRPMGHRAWSIEQKILTPLAPCSMLSAKSEPFCRTISVNWFIISPKQGNWKKRHPGYFMNCCRETAKMGVPHGTAGWWFRGVPKRYAAGAGTRGRQEGRPYPRSQQVIHEISGIHCHLGEVDET